MPIQNILRHRALIQRATDTFVKGSPSKAWAVIADSVLHPIPVLYSKDSADHDPAWTASEQAESDQRGTLFARADADILPGDRVTITRPELGTFEVLPDPAKVSRLDILSHKEYKVRSIKSPNE